MTATLNKQQPTAAPPAMAANGGSGKGTGRPVGVSSLGTPQRRKQLPWVALGVLLVASSTLGFALWSTQQGARTPTLVAANNISAGEIVERADVRVVAIGADPGVSLLAVGEESLVVGKIARTEIAEGTPLSAPLVTETDAVPAGMSIVGAVLGAGAYPTSSLRAGDRVELVRVASSSTADVLDTAVLGTGTIWALEETSGTSERRMFVSIAVPAGSSTEVATTASQNRLRLVLVGGEGQ